MSETVDFAAIAAAIRQHLEADRILGVREVPIAPGPAGPINFAAPAAAQASAGDNGARLAELGEQVRGCKKCALHEGRTNTVFGVGNPHARLVFVGEAPGYHEDQKGEPFVGKAGALLTDIIKAMQFRREDVYICNVLKCRPPENRNPAPEEVVACSPYLFGQLQAIQPEIIVALGLPAVHTLLKTTASLGSLRGRFHDFHLAPDGPPIKLMPTYHPAYLLRSPREKGKTWDDMKMVMTELGIEVPERYR